jgi:predicted nuclease with TOPRIM domain
MNAHFRLRVIMELTADMQAILNFLKRFGVGSTAEIAFCTLIAESRVEIDVKDMADECWVSLSTDSEDNTVAKIVNHSKEY